MISKTFSHNFKGNSFAFVATLFWAGNLIVARDLASEISPFTLAFGRWFIAVISFAPFMLSKSMKQWGLIKKNLPFLLIISFLGISLLNSIIYQAAHSSQALNMALISISYPVFVMLLSKIFFGEKLGYRNILAVLIMFMGILILISQGTPENLLKIHFVNGDLWMLLSSFIFASYSVILRKRPVEMSFDVFQFSSFVLGLLMLAPFAFYERFDQPALSLDHHLILSWLYIGIFASLLGYSLWNKAVETVGAVRCGIIYYSLPLFASIMSYLYLSEPIKGFHILSSGFIISGLYLANKVNNKA